MFAWNQHTVCFVEGPADTYVLLAIRPERQRVTPGLKEVVVWDDGTRQRGFVLEAVVDETRDRFAFRDDQGREFVLQPLTAKRYANTVRFQVRGPELKSDQAVKDFYLAPRAW